MTAELQRFTSGNWFADLQRRNRLSEPLPIAGDEYNILHACREDLIAWGGMHPRKLLGGDRYGESKRTRTLNPSRWLIGPHLNERFRDLIYKGPIGETEEQKAERLEPLKSFYREVYALHKLALTAWNTVRPPEQLGEVLAEKLRALCASGEDICSPKVINTLMDYRDALRPYEDSNPAAATIALQFDQAVMQVRDTLRERLLRRYFSGELTDDEKRQTVELLQADADCGAWADPEADISRIEAETSEAA
jgi:hypothetical protein